jgi:hypothetical protein
MICHDNTIKELLPLYAEEALDEAGKNLAEAHVESCADCRSELALLRTLAAEPVPDPGQVFWETMPGRVFRAVQEQQTKKKGWHLSWLRAPLLPRWSWTAAALAVALLFSWVLVISGIRNGTEDAAEYQEMALRDPADTVATVNMADLSGSDLDTVNTWAGQQLTQIARDAQSAAPNTSLLNLPDDLYEDLADLNAHEMDRFSGMLKEYSEEG